MANIQEKQIRISREEKNGITAEFIKKLFDYKDGHLYWKIKSGRGIIIGGQVGSVMFNGYDHRHAFRFKRIHYYTSRSIFLWHNGYIPEHVDHIDRNPLNNRIENLRASDPLKNQMNKTSAKNSSCQYLGVSNTKNHKRWQACIRINKKTKYLGTFDTQEEAALAYNKAAVKYFGEFANLNIIKLIALPLDNVIYM